MNRRDSLKAIGLTAVSSAVLLEACKEPENTGDKPIPEETKAEAGREQWEIDRDKKLKAETYFTKHELATITVLADIIIPKDDVSGSASDAKVPEFIEFIVKDIPEHKVPMRGGLKWLDVYCFNKFSKSFIEASADQQISIIDEIAYPKRQSPKFRQALLFSIE